MLRAILKGVYRQTGQHLGSHYRASLQPLPSDEELASTARNLVVSATGNHFDDYLSGKLALDVASIAAMALDIKQHISGDYYHVIP